MNHASHESPEKTAAPAEDDDPRHAPASAPHAKPRRLTAWTCRRCGARKHLRGARRD